MPLTALTLVASTTAMTALMSRRAVAAGATATAISSIPHRAVAAGAAAVGSSAATVSSLTDENGQYVVDPSKAAAGLLDPLTEPNGAYATISAALAVAPSGSTVVVRPGTYNERLFVTRPLTIAAEPGAMLSWTSNKPYEAALTVNLGSAGPVTVKNLSIRHSSPSIAQNYAVFVPQQESVDVDARSEIELRYVDVSSSSGSGVGVEGGRVTLNGCRVHDCKNHGVLYLGRSARGAVRGCSIEACKLSGLLLRDGASPTVEANRMNANGQYGMSLFDCRARLGSNEVKGNGKGAVSGECDDLEEG